MKKLLFLLAIASCCATSCTQQNCNVSGHIDGVASDTLIISLLNEQMNDYESIDTVAMKNGDFSYDVNVSEARYLSIVPLLKPGERQIGEISFLVLPKEKAVVTGTFSDYKFSGSKFYQDFEEVRNTVTKVTDEEIKALEDEFSAARTAGGNMDSIQALFTQKWKETVEKLENNIRTYVKANPDSEISAYLATNLDIDEALSLLSDRVKTGVMAPILNTLKERSDKDKEREALSKRLESGTEPAPDFTLNDINGKPFTLSSLRGKFVVLDFWGSWCGWCIKGFPDMKEAYAKHKAKVEFVGIDCGDGEEQWKAAVAQYELPWLQVYNSKENDVTETYAISGFPTKIVINPEGTIIKVVVGEDPEFYTYLDEILK